MKQRDADSFKEWITKIETANTLLSETTHKFSEDQIREHVEANVCEDLYHLLSDGKTTDI